MVDRAAMRWGIPPWELERAAQDSPAAMRWLLLSPSLEQYADATERRLARGR